MYEWILQEVLGGPTNRKAGCFAVGTRQFYGSCNKYLVLGTNLASVEGQQHTRVLHTQHKNPVLLELRHHAPLNPGTSDTVLVYLCELHASANVLTTAVIAPADAVPGCIGQGPTSPQKGGSGRVVCISYAPDK